MKSLLLFSFFVLNSLHVIFRTHHAIMRRKFIRNGMVKDLSSRVRCDILQTVNLLVILQSMYCGTNANTD